MILFSFASEHIAELLLKCEQQLYLVAASTVIGLLLAMPLGIFVQRMPRAKHILLSMASLFWTIPSLALLAFLIPFFGIGTTPAIIALTVYCFLPILRNTITGLDSVPTSAIEAAQGLGFTRWQQLWIVEIPLAMPVIIAGIRTAVTISVGIATLAAFIGAGGLGDFINRGLAMNNNSLILLGAIPAALMALVLDFIIGRVENLLVTRRYRQVKTKRRLKVSAVIFTVLLVLVFVWRFERYETHLRENTVVVASKNFTEQFILADIIIELLRAKTHLHVVSQLDLGTTAICQEAMKNGDIDIYPEYTGTAYLTVLHRQYQRMEPDVLYHEVKQAYQQHYHITWLKPFGFENTQALAMRSQEAKRLHIASISQLVGKATMLTMGAPPEFVVRPDAMPGLKKAYRLHFHTIRAMDPGLMYKAIHEKHVDVIMAFSTDGRILAYHLTTLKDDKHFFPPYFAAALVRDSVLQAHPHVKTVLNELAGTINFAIMQRLNYQVDLAHQTPAQVAHNFLLKAGLL